MTIMCQFSDTSKITIAATLINNSTPFPNIKDMSEACFPLCDTVRGPCSKSLWPRHSFSSGFWTFLHANQE